MYYFFQLVRACIFLQKLKFIHLQKQIYFSPVIDGKFFPKKVAELRKESVASNVPYIMGVNNTEGAGLLVLQYPKDFDQGISEEVCTESLKGIIGGMLLVCAIGLIIG